jgi:hypothetical protein
MKKLYVSEILALATILILLVSLTLLVLKRMSALIFFIILGIAALIAYKLIPMLREKEQGVRKGKK